MLGVVRELTGAPAASLTAETPLMEAGVDSLAATELSSRLRSLAGVVLSARVWRAICEGVARALYPHYEGS